MNISDLVLQQTLPRPRDAFASSYWLAFVVLVVTLAPVASLRIRNYGNALKRLNSRPLGLRPTHHLKDPKMTDEFSQLCGVIAAMAS